MIKSTVSKGSMNRKKQKTTDIEKVSKEQLFAISPRMRPVE